MPFKVKEHFRKTKKGLVVVKESTRKDKLKKALTIAAGGLVTLGLGALAYKKLGSKVITNNVETKLLKGTANKIDNLVTKETSNISSKADSLVKQTHEKLPDPWEEPIIKGNDKSLVTSKLKEKPKLLKPGNIEDVKNAEWEDYLKTIDRQHQSREPLDIGNRSITNTKVSNTNQLTIRKDIDKKKSLARRDNTYEKQAKERLQLAEQYKNSNSPSLQQTGANYERAAKQNLANIEARRQARTVSKTKTGLVTSKGNASKSSVKHPYQEEVTKAPDIVPETKSTTPKKKGKGRRAFLTGGKSSQELAENFLESTVKTTINKAGDNVSDLIIPGSSEAGKALRMVKGRIKQFEKLSSELEKNGDKPNTRRQFLAKTVNKVLEEGSLKPADAETVAKGAATRGKKAVQRTLGMGSRTPEAELYTAKDKAFWNAYGMQVGEKMPKRIYRKSQGAAESISQIARKFLRYKSGGYDGSGF